MWTLEDVRTAYREHPVRAREIAQGLDHQAFSRRSAEDGWSVGECIDHLSVVAEQILPRLDAAIETTRERGFHAKPGAELPRTSWFDRLVVTLMGSDPHGGIPFPVHAPKHYHPAEDLDPETVLARFDAVCARFFEQLERGRALDLSRLRVPALAFPVVHLVLASS